ncbi:transposase (plasmid) [Arthrobacter citreus]|nr:transposase [Arthrobacter citreus]
MVGVHLLNPEYGYSRMTDSLIEKSYRINHKKVYRLMKEMKIQSFIRKKRKRHGKTSSVIYIIDLRENLGLQDLIKKWLRIFPMFRMVNNFIIYQSFKIYLIMKL